MKSEITQGLRKPYRKSIFTKTAKSIETSGKFPKDLLKIRGLKYQEIEIFTAMLQEAEDLRKKGKRDTSFINWYSKDLKEIYGNEYSKFFTNLVTWGLIRKNPSYLTASSAFEKGKKSYPMSYAVRGDILNQKLAEISYQIPLSFINKTINKTKTDTGEYLTPFHKRMLEVHQKIEWVGKVPKTPKGKISCAKIKQKICNGRKQTNERYGHVFLQMKKDLRKNCRLGGERIANVDIHSAVQSILQIVLENSEEELKYWKYLCNHNKGFHENIKDVCLIKGKRSKQWIKDRFMHSMGTIPIIPSNTANKAAIAMLDYVKEYFPTIYKWKETLEKEGKTVAGETQMFEARIIKHFIMSNLDIEMLTACDGVFCKASDASEVSRRLEKFLSDKFKIITTCGITIYDDSEREKQKKDKIARDFWNWFAGVEPEKPKVEKKKNNV